MKDEIIREIFKAFSVEMSDGDFLDEGVWEDLFREAIPAPTAPEAPTYTAFDDEGHLYLKGDILAREAYEAASAVYQDRLEAYSDASNRADLAWQYIVTFFEAPATTERQIIKALEDAFEAVEDYGGGNLANAYYQIVTCHGIFPPPSIRVRPNLRTDNEANEIHGRTDHRHPGRA
ncbi:MAG: hypothetical protein V2I43_16095, partial [Parvularcula sp.]|nr:hypothetical protein [Parvularcula sp.]